MACLMAKPCVETAKSWEGYTSDGLYNAYAERLDQCDFFAGCGKKNGAVDYCGIAVCYWMFVNVYLDSGEEPSDDDRKYMVHYAMYQSDSCCTSAGCTQQSDAYKANNAWYTSSQECERGDQIFFQKSNGQIYHTGMCTGFDESGIYVTEANVEGRQTLTRFYPYSEFGKKIAGFGRPRYDGWEASESSDDEDVEPTPAPAPEPTPEPSYDKYEVVGVSSFLNVREAPTKNSKSIWKLFDGDIVTIYEEQDGWGRIDDYGWVCMDYLKKI